MSRTIITPLAIAFLSIASVSAKQPLKVFILAGQSNMEGHAKVSVLDYVGEDPQTAPMLKQIKNADGTHRMIDGVWISYLTGEQGRLDRDNREVFGQLTAGYGNQGGRNYDQPGQKIGPELMFGITMQKGLGEPVLLIKTAWGGQSLHTDYRSPSSGPYVPSPDDIKRERFSTPEKQAELKKKTGARYKQMIDHVRFVLSDIKRVYPDYDLDQGYELAGLVWFQGFNDMVGRNVYPEVKGDTKTPRFAKYTEWFGNFIRDTRKDLNAPKMPFVIGVMGVGGMMPNAGNQAFRESQAAVADLPEFKDNVFAVPTAPFWDERLGEIDKKRDKVRQKSYLLRTENKNHENADGKMTKEQQRAAVTAFEKTLFTDDDYDLEKRGKSNAGYHYLGSAKTFVLIGQAFANALLENRPSKN